MKQKLSEACRKRKQTARDRLLYSLEVHHALSRLKPCCQKKVEKQRKEVEQVQSMLLKESEIAGSYTIPFDDADRMEWKHWKEPNHLC